MRRFYFFGSKPEVIVQALASEEDTSVDTTSTEPGTSSLNSIDVESPTPTEVVPIDQSDLKKALNEYTEDDWKNFAKNHPNIVKMITEVSNENKVGEITNEDSNSCSELMPCESNANKADRKLSIFLAPRQLVTKFIELSLAFIGQFYQKIQDKLSQENLKLIDEVLTEILQSFAYTQNRENSVAIAFVLRGLNSAQSLPTIKEIPNIGIYITVLTILIEVVKVVVHISFGSDKEELRRKISKIFE